MVLDTTPFYAESGGQVGDEGVITSGSAKFAVGDTQKIKADVFGHHGEVAQGTLAVGDGGHRVGQPGMLRAATVRNHSATHLMHKALREVLGTHVQQKGSLVNAERTRFDFTHNAPVTDAQIRQVEAIVNAEVLANAVARAELMDIEAAKTDRRDDAVRRKIWRNRARAEHRQHHRTLRRHPRQGHRRYRPVQGGGRRWRGRRCAPHRSRDRCQRAGLPAVSGRHREPGRGCTLKAPAAELTARIGHTLEQVRALEKEVAALKGKLASSQGDELMAQAVDVKGIKVLAAVLNGADAKTLRETLDKLKDKLKTAAIVLAAVDGGKVQIAAGVTADSMGKVKAGELVNFVAQQVGGKGGGKPDMAMAGGTDASGLPKALASVQAWVSEKL